MYLLSTQAGIKTTKYIDCFRYLKLDLENKDSATVVWITSQAIKLPGNMRNERSINTDSHAYRTGSRLACLPAH